MKCGNGSSVMGNRKTSPLFLPSIYSMRLRKDGKCSPPPSAPGGITSHDGLVSCRGPLHGTRPCLAGDPRQPAAGGEDVGGVAEYGVPVASAVGQGRVVRVTLRV